MNSELSQFGLAILMVLVAGSLIVWFWKYRRAASQKRMMQMLTRAGVAPDVIERGDVQAIMKDVQSRCRACNSEDLCERWLAGKVEGENDFCPNAQIFRSLTEDAGPVAP